MALRHKTVSAQSASHLESVRALFREYERSLGIDLGFQDFEREVVGLPGAYAPPSGGLWLAVEGEAALGCVGVRSLESGICEMKRLYVRPEARGHGLGRQLALTAIEFGRQAGHHAMRLDTLPSMVQARAMYQALGFREIPAYRFGTAFLELILEG